MTIVTPRAKLFLFLLAVFAFTPAVAQADVRTVDDVVRVLNRVAALLFSYILVPFTIIFLLLAGFKYLTAQGSSEKISEANRMLFYAVVSFAVGLVARGVATLVDQLIAR